MDTQDSEYAARLEQLSGARWKRLLNVQAPYQWRLRRYDLGRTLDVGCGIGRNLASLAAGSLGVDHNADSIRMARTRGFSASTAEEFLAQPDPEPFESLLLAHVLEHMTFEDAVTVVSTYSSFVRPGGRVLFICPQQRGYASDATHVNFLTGAGLQAVAREAGIRPGKPSSFPFPASAGSWFKYNETHLLSRAG